MNNILKLSQTLEDYSSGKNEELIKQQVNKKSFNLNKYKQSWSKSIKKKIFSGKDDKFSGNCGMYALALAQKTIDEGKEAVIVIAANTGDTEELKYGEPNIYHVAVEIDGILYDGSGVTSEQKLAQFAYDIYGDSSPALSYFKFDEAIIELIRQETNWDTNYQEYFKDIKKDSKAKDIDTEDGDI